MAVLGVLPLDFATVLGDTSPFFPGIRILSSKPSEPQGKQRSVFEKRRMVERMEKESTPRTTHIFVSLFPLEHELLLANQLDAVLTNPTGKWLGPPEMGGFCFWSLSKPKWVPPKATEVGVGCSGLLERYILPFETWLLHQNKRKPPSTRQCSGVYCKDPCCFPGYG